MHGLRKGAGLAQCVDAGAAQAGEEFNVRQSQEAVLLGVERSGDGGGGCDHGNLKTSVVVGMCPWSPETVIGSIDCVVAQRVQRRKSRAGCGEVGSESSPATTLWNPPSEGAVP